ncbi:MAG: 16S rRNA (guanine(966)-N(2))-methyltransferase RsmD [Moraxellaceae bacterium]|nr:MAG: 16S rRNA (guanine(966)-N(2))-methyltransferase RsmD [Moraxellaceae bacterium]
MPRKSTTKPPQTSQLKIIAGRWRGRPIKFLQLEGVRPTPNRIRETLFNWLAPTINDARCLDLFAGSGILGIEALSRGASECTFLDLSAEVCYQIKAQLNLLDAGSHKVILSDTKSWLQSTAPKNQYDIIFLDPPFHQNLLPEYFQLLEAKEILAPGGALYVESESPINPVHLPNRWSLERYKSAGNVHYGLILATGN